MYALQNDTNPGVRLKALDGLSSFVRQDPQSEGWGFAGSDQRYEFRGPNPGFADW